MVRKTHVKANARKVETGGEHGTPTNAEKAIPWTPDEVANLFLLAYSKLPLTQSNVQAICEKLGTDRTPL
ncbi:uncharacterized protein PFL1_03755 [Pseudozyma flocculosa PF-1]|nr:uncharacterized protein PFL1_03755 [Pseudozyma flocculosa PF-1]EPQ28452.1 hypothetical protein PFL1_03755 [Pseudozyma flocculosa PF-1]